MTMMTRRQPSRERTTRRMSEVDTVIARFPTEQAAALQGTREAILHVLPGAAEGISWGMPTFRIDGDIVMSLMGFREHNSLFPGSAVASQRLVQELADYTITKGTIHFDRDRPFPLPLLKKVLRVRIDEINEGYPKSSGVTKAFYDNGRLKYLGREKDGIMLGRWQWFRRDGTLLRTGEFRRGEKVGTWTTYDASGQPAKVTRVT